MSSKEKPRRAAIVLPGYSKPQQPVVAEQLTTQISVQPQANDNAESSTVSTLPTEVTQSEAPIKAPELAKSLEIRTLEDFLGEGMGKVKALAKNTLGAESDIDAIAAKESVQPTILRLAPDVYKLEEMVFRESKYKSKQKMRHAEYVRGLVSLASKLDISVAGLNLEIKNKR